MIEFDSGPPPAVAEHFAKLPSYATQRDLFWFDWGPIFYRGRLDKSARVLVIASDPGPTERVAHRTLVGDAGQRVQGFLHKLGLTRSYVCVNAFAYALIPSHAGEAAPLLRDPAQVAWRNTLLDQVTGTGLQAIIAFGVQGREALELWPGLPNVKRLNLPHPSSRDPKKLVETWREAITTLRASVTPDADGQANAANYGPTFRETDYRRVPARDLPFGVPAFLGDDAWSRKQQSNTSVERPKGDFKLGLLWHAPEAP
jgi:hypothetical protein